MTEAESIVSRPADGRSATLGVLGGGQLGRMFVHAAQVHGYRVVVLEPDAGSPAGAAADLHLLAPYTDQDSLASLTRRCSAVTTEFENVPAGALRQLMTACVVSPPADAVEVCQHRAREKQLFAEAGVPCAPFALVDSAAAARDPALVALLPGILKTASLGYDGKGQAVVASPAELAAAFAALGGVACVLEKRLELAHEISVIVARGGDGRWVHLPVQQNLHRAGILAVTQVPAPDVPADLAQQAVALAGRLAQALHYVGVLCVEFFVLADGGLVANEMAPRPHNSGHYSIDACDLSQFDLQVRTLAGLPLVQPRQHSAAVMLNLLGDLWRPEAPGRTGAPDWAAVLALPGTHLHLYGKAEPRPGRKMGHLTITAASPAAARSVALQAAALLGLPAF
ncbi:MAG TPA: 5-(carboxyamino)imidazole ribonucleotide synthase [Rubrivivax sp.]|nr:5-(carboxyamino)imidazole ribonucleotide synthase [Rubrivivax sp.]